MPELFRGKCPCIQKPTVLLKTTFKWSQMQTVWNPLPSSIHWFIKFEDIYWEKCSTMWLTVSHSMNGSFNASVWSQSCGAESVNILVVVSAKMLTPRHLPDLTNAVKWQQVPTIAVFRIFRSFMISNDKVHSLIKETPQKNIKLPWH